MPFTWSRKTKYPKQGPFLRYARNPQIAVMRNTPTDRGRVLSVCPEIRQTVVSRFNHTYRGRTHHSIQQRSERNCNTDGGHQFIALTVAPKTDRLRSLLNFSRESCISRTGVLGSQTEVVFNLSYALPNTKNLERAAALIKKTVFIGK